MTSLERIRNKAGLLIGVVGFALFAFVVGDFWRPGASLFTGSKEIVAEVDGEKLKIQDYQQLVSKMTQVYEIQLNQTSLTEEYSQAVRDRVFEDFVNDVLLGRVFSEVGIDVSAKELTDITIGDNPSQMLQNVIFAVNQQTRQLDKAALTETIKQIYSPEMEQNPQMADQVQRLRTYWEYWERQIKQQRKIEKYNALMAKLVVPNKLDVKDAVVSRSNTSDIAYTSQSFESVPDSLVKITDAEYKKAYDAKKDMFKTYAESRQIKYLSVSIAPSDDDFKNVASDMEKARVQLTTSDDVAEVVRQFSDLSFNGSYLSANRFSPFVKEFLATAAVGSISDVRREGNSFSLAKLVGTVVGADSIKVRYAMVPATDPAKIDSTSTALLADLKSGKTTYAAEAEKYGVQNGGDMGWMTEDMAVQALSGDFKTQIFAAALNTPFLFSSNGRGFIFEVTEKTKSVTKYNVAQVVKTVTASSATRSKIYNDLSTILSANSNFSQFVAIAPSTGYMINTIENLNPNDPMIDNVKNSRPVVSWAFNAKKNEVSKIFEANDNLFVAAVETIRDKGYRSLEEVKTTLAPEIYARKKGEKIVADLKAKNLSSLQAYASQMAAGKIDSATYIAFNRSSISKIGHDPVLVGNVAAAKKGVLSGPVAGRSAVYVFNVYEQKVDSSALDEKTELVLLKRNNGYRLMNQLIPSIRQQADVEDFRYRFY